MVKKMSPDLLDVEVTEQSENFEVGTLDFRSPDEIAEAELAAIKNTKTFGGIIHPFLIADLEPLDIFEKMGIGIATKHSVHDAVEMNQEQFAAYKAAFDLTVQKPGMVVFTNVEKGIA